MLQFGQAGTPLLIFDGDDTLWDTMPLYDKAKARLFGFLKSRGTNAATVADFFEREDVSNVTQLGFGLDRFEKSIRNTIGSFCPPLKDDDKVVVDDLVYSIRQSIEHGPTPVVQDAPEILADLRQYYRLILLTKGDPIVQENRVESSGLAQFFERVFIVPEKREETFNAILAVAQTRASDGWSIGNSLRSDILPAARIGMQTIWIQNPTWAWEDVPSEIDTRIYRVHTLSDIREILIPIGE